MPVGSLPWLCMNRWPNEGRARSMREAYGMGASFVAILASSKTGFGAKAPPTETIFL